jgi:energy-coupling factor transporter transmembrane protein EcfT
MKSLAIASLILGILGFLLSFMFGLGLLPSILAIILGIAPLTKKELRPIVISGLILGLLGVFISISFFSITPEDIMEEARPSKTEIKLGEGVKIGELLVKFTSIKIVKEIKRGNWIKKPKQNYKFVIVEVKAQNIGKEKDGIDGIFDYQNYKIEVDKGYLYEPILGEGRLSFELLPEESSEDSLVFEILEKTFPVKLHALIKNKNFTVILK